MKPTSIFLSLALSLCGSLLGTSICRSAPISAATAKQEIADTLRQRTEAHDRKDVAGYMRTFSTKYVIENVLGKTVTYAQLQSIMTDRLSHGMLGSTHATITNVTVRGKTARVSVEAMYTYPTGKTNAYIYSKTVSDQTWVKTPHGWQEQHEQMTIEETIYSKKPLTDAF